MTTDEAPAAPPATLPTARDAAAEGTANAPPMETRALSAWFGSHQVLADVDLRFPENTVTALIGPSGCGKSTYIRTLNRMHELVPGAAVSGQVLLHGRDIYARGADAVAIRRAIGMVFQKPNPFPKTVWENVAFGPKINGYKGDLNELVERSLRRAALWDDVKDKLKQSGMALSGGQQQRLCIARTIAVNPEVILMDEPCSALDPRSTLQIEELMDELKRDYTIDIVTHNMQQAARASDTTIFMTMGEDRAGYVVEQGPTMEIFTNPALVSFDEQLTIKIRNDAGGLPAATNLFSTTTPVSQIQSEPGQPGFVVRVFGSFAPVPPIIVLVMFKTPRSRKIAPPSPACPKSSLAVALSLLAVLFRIVEPLKVKVLPVLAVS